jgi:RNA polymerase sigma-70 factor (ECF subfamily)
MRERDPAVPAPPLSAAAFTALVDRNQHALHAFLRGLVGHGEQARDLVQDTFHDAWRAAQRGTPPFDGHADDDAIRRWLFRTAYCRGVSALRRRRLIHWEQLERITEACLEGAERPFEDLIAEGEALRAALACLAPSDAACLLLRVVQGFSAAEVGQIVGATPDVITKRLSRAKQRLRVAYLAHETRTEENARQ